MAHWKTGKQFFGTDFTDDTVKGIGFSRNRAIDFLGTAVRLGPDLSDDRRQRTEVGDAERRGLLSSQVRMLTLPGCGFRTRNFVLMAITIAPDSKSRP
jgi:hypothetical protein